jgi:hypothetical protein
MTTSEDGRVGSPTLPCQTGSIEDLAPTRNELRIKVGKYTFARPVPYYLQRLDIFYDGCKISTVSSDRNDAIGIMMDHFIAAQGLVEAVRDIVEAPPLLRKKFLLEALALHDSLCSASCGRKPR